MNSPSADVSFFQYGDPLLDQLDIHHVVHHRLFRESCYNHQGNYVKVRFPPNQSLFLSLSLSLSLVLVADPKLRTSPKSVATCGKPS